MVKIENLIVIAEPLRGFLIRKGLYQTFMCRVYEYQSDVGRRDDVFRRGGIQTISEAFPWIKTPEGQGFWQEIAGMDKEE